MNTYKIPINKYFPNEIVTELTITQYNLMSDNQKAIRLWKLISRDK